MSHFIILLKRSSESMRDEPALQVLPEICILELTSDKLAYLWPAECVLSTPVSLDPKNPADQELLLTGEFISCGGFFYSVSDYLRCNDLSEDLFYLFFLGNLRDVTEAREALRQLKVML